MESLGKRIQRLRLDARMTQGELAKICKNSKGKPINKASVSAWEAGDANPSLENLLILAEHFRISLDSLVAGVDNVAEGPSARLKVPLISWVQAGAGEEAIDLYEPGVAEDWVPCAQPHSARAYALRVRGHSMTSDGERSYPEGRIIICDPEQIGGAVSGQRVIARLEDETVTFKELVIEDGNQWLRALNKAYPPISMKFEIIAVVIGVHIPE